MSLKILSVKSSYVYEIIELHFEVRVFHVTLARLYYQFQSVSNQFFKAQNFDKTYTYYFPNIVNS